MAMPFRKSLVHDGPLQHEIETLLREQWAAAQLQGISRKKLKGAIEKTLESTSAKAPMRNTGGADPPVCGRPPGRPRPNRNPTARTHLSQKLRRHIPRATRIHFRIAQS